MKLYKKGGGQNCPPPFLSHPKAAPGCRTLGSNFSGKQNLPLPDFRVKNTSKNVYQQLSISEVVRHSIDCFPKMAAICALQFGTFCQQIYYNKNYLTLATKFIHIFVLEKFCETL